MEFLQIPIERRKPSLTHYSGGGGNRITFADSRRIVLKIQKQMWYLLSLSLCAHLSFWHCCQLVLEPDMGWTLEYIWGAAKTIRYKHQFWRSAWRPVVITVEERQRHMARGVLSVWNELKNDIYLFNFFKSQRSLLYIFFLNIFQPDSIDADSSDKPPLLPDYCILLPFTHPRDISWHFQH